MNFTLCYQFLNYVLKYRIMIEKIKLRLSVLEGMNEPFARTESEKAVIKELIFLIEVLG